MIITALQHGLGNQLFQYAIGRALAERLRAPLLVDTTHFTYDQTRKLDLHQFNVRARFLPDALAKLATNAEGGNPLKTVLKSLVGMGIHSLVDRAQGYDPRVEQLGWFSRLDGFWQAERYFAAVRPQLLAEFQPRHPLPEKMAEFVRRAANEPSIALHVRRGDLVNSRHYVETVGALGPGYFHEALTRLKARLPDGRVYVFSDDPEWCANHLPDILPTELVSGRVTHSAVEDLVAMKACRHFIIANSTFSWWAAWLGTHPEKQVITPERFHRVARPWEVDLLPSAWERIEPAFLPMDEPAVRQ